MQYVKQAGVWKIANSGYIKQAGVWKRINGAYIKQAGVWKRFGYSEPGGTGAITTSGTFIVPAYATITFKLWGPGGGGGAVQGTNGGDGTDTKINLPDGDIIAGGGKGGKTGAYRGINGAGGAGGTYTRGAGVAGSSGGTGYGANTGGASGGGTTGSYGDGGRGGNLMDPSDGHTQAGGGGGGGAYTEITFDSSNGPAIGSSLTLTVGTKGAAGTDGVNNGLAGEPAKIEVSWT